MLRAERDGPVLRLTLDRPEVRNAFNDTLIAALADAFAGIAWPGVRAVVLAGAGGAFCAGGDLEWMRRAAGYSEAENAADARRLAALFQAIVDCPAVVIARVAGPCFGGGCGLVAAADVAIADVTARFAFSEVKLGLVPATISRFVVPKIGAGHARALFATGAPFDASRALVAGLVHGVVAPDCLDDAVAETVQHVLNAGPEAVRLAKRLALSPPADDAAAAELLARARASEEGREGVAAFLEKRRAAFAAETK